MRFKPEQLNQDAPPPILETEDAIRYLGVELKKGQGGEHTPRIERFEDDVVTNYDLELMQRIAVGLSLNQPVLVEGGSGIGKSQTVDRMCAEVNRESYYANCHDYDADTLIGAPTHKEDTKSGFGWKDGVIIQAARKGGILFLDEYNFMRGDTRGRLHEVLDSILRGKGEISLTENNNETVKVHPDFRIVAAQNPPGGEYGDREVLDPAQIDRFVYIKEPMKLSSEVRTARLLGRIGKDNKITIPKESYITQGEFLSAEEVANIPGIEDLMKKYVEVSEALEREVENRTIARGASQPVIFGTPRDDKRIFEFIQHFYHGDISKTFQDALRYYYMNKVLDEVDREKIASLIEQVKYVPPQNSPRQAPRAPQIPGTPPPLPSVPGTPKTPESKEGLATLEEAERIMGNNFLGPKEINLAFHDKVRVKETPRIPFTVAELERANELGQELILCVDKALDGQPLSMKKMNEILKGKAKDDNKLLYDTDWYKDEDFYKNKAPQLGWKLTSKEVIPGSTSKNYVDQTQVIIGYLLKEAFTGKQPVEYLMAIDEFEKKKAEIKKLLDSNWEKAAEEIEKLKITALTRETPEEVLYRLILSEEKSGKKSLPSTYTWTNRRASDGKFVDVGPFASHGLSVFRYAPGYSYPALGVCVSRRS